MASAPNETEGRRLGEWTVGRRIAVGGMAEIFEARRAGSAAPVVLKLLLPQHARDPEFVRMLEDEARVQSMLSHPNLVQVHAFGRDDGQPWLALERVDGAPLSELCEAARAAGTPLPPSAAVAILGDVLAALEYVHAARDPAGRPLGIVHRDVTPHNVLVDRDGRARLGDFGIARSTIRDGRTRTGVIKGKVRYLAPEQVTGSAVDARTDLYAAGLVLHELLTGAPFLQGETEIELLRASEAPRYRSVRDAGVDARFDRILEPALARFPEERWPTASAFREAIERLAAEMALPSSRAPLPHLVETLVPVPTSLALLADERTTSRAMPLPPPRVGRGRRRHVVVAIAAAVLAGTAGAFVALERMAPPRPATAPPTRETLARALAPRPRVERLAAERRPSAPASVEEAAGPTRPRAKVLVPPAPVGPSSSPPVPVDEPALAALRARVVAARAVLQQRGILVQDLAPEAREAAGHAEAAIRRGERAPAEAATAIFERAAGEARVDASFVRSKLDRVHRALRAAEARGRDVTALQDLAATALQDLAERDYEATNRRLNEILRRL